MAVCESKGDYVAWKSGVKCAKYASLVTTACRFTSSVSGNPLGLLVLMTYRLLSIDAGKVDKIPLYQIAVIKNMRSRQLYFFLEHHFQLFWAPELPNS